MSNLGKKASDDDDVEQLLRAAHDDVLLKLSLNSHMARAASAAAIDPDLDRRFQALKKPQKLTKHDDSVKRPPKEEAAGDDNSKAAAVSAGDDLLARFTALKNALPSNSSNFPASVDRPAADEEEEEEDEVEKVIKWAIDAARLDPSPQSDDDDDHHHHNDESDDSSDDDGGGGGGVGRGKKSRRK